MATQSGAGNRSGFSGIFSLVENSVKKEKELLESMLKEYATDGVNITTDLHSLISITSEVKAINNQAAILHGERIKKAHAIPHPLPRRRFFKLVDGRLRQPANALQFHAVLRLLPYHAQNAAAANRVDAKTSHLHTRNQNRSGGKEAGDCGINGETKTELLTRIRTEFPLDKLDKRRQKVGEGVIMSLKRLSDVLAQKPLTITREQKNTIYDLLAHVNHLISQSS